MRKEQLVEGKIYSFKKIITGRDNKKKITTERWRLVEKFTHHAMFENQYGIRRCFQYWDIDKLLNGGVDEE